MRPNALARLIKDHERRRRLPAAWGPQLLGIDREVQGPAAVMVAVTTS